MMHGQHHEVVEAFVTGINKLSSGYRTEYYDYAYDMSTLTVRQKLEETMRSSTYPNSPFGREYFGRGEAQGLEKGRVAEAAKTILLILEARGLEISDKASARITACTDLDQLETWVRRTATAQTTDDLFNDPT